MDDDDQDKESIAGWIRNQWDRADRALSEERQDYWLNYSFVEGKQWVFWHAPSRTVADFPRALSDDRTRLTSNRMQPNLVVLLTRLTKRELSFEVPASSADDSTLAGARLAEHVLEAMRIDGGWEAIRRDEIHAAFLGGSSAVAVEWNPKAGEELGVDNETGKVVTGGECQLSAYSITEFTLEPGTRNWRDARWWIGARAMPPSQVRDHWGLDKDPPSDKVQATGPLARQLHLQRGWPVNIDLSTVYTYYERPSKKNKKGRYVVSVGDEVIVDQAWPFKTDRLNLYPFRQLQQPKKWTGATMLNDARPLQVAFNHGMSNLTEHMKKVGTTRMVIPDTANVDADTLTDEPGEVIYFDGTQPGKPGWMEMPHIDRWLVQYVDNVAAQLDDVMAVHDISRGEAPGDRNSGLALSLLAEKDETPLGQMAHDQAEGWSYLASFILDLLAEKVTEYRTATVTTPSGVPLTYDWNGKALKNQTRARVPLDATMPHSRVAMHAWILNVGQQFPGMLQQLAANPAQLARLLELPSAGMFGQMLDADVAQAEVENLLMSIGQIPSYGDEPAPKPFENHAVHIAEHNRLRKQPSYINGTPEVRHIVDMHILAHENAELAQARKQAEMNAILPGAAGMPQADEPTGSSVPMDYAERPELTAPPPVPTGT